jgi:hypothetical protein
LKEQILQAIDEQIATLREVRAILTSSKTPGRKKPAGKAETTASHSSTQPRRQLSAKARRAIADAQRRRWAKVNSLKKAAETAVPARKETVAS